MRQSSPARINGFTLVELLVVIGIIAVLIGILLPSLNKAREAAKRAACASNLHQLHIVFNNYATMFKGVVPIGGAGAGSAAGGHAEANNYFLSRKNAASPDPDPLPNGQPANGRYVGMGLLFKAGLIKAGEGGRVFFCPSQNNNNHEFNVPDNPWPPNNIPATEGTGIRAGYSQRISTNNTNPISASTWATDGVAWLGQGPFYPVKIIAGLAKPTHEPARMHRFGSLKNKSMVADIMSSYTRTRPAHKGGVNVLYANGAVKWQNGDTYEKQHTVGGGGMFASTADYLQDQIWNNFDAERQLYP